MLMGEHAVLFGQPALVCALDVRIHISVTPRDDRSVTIKSALGDYQSSLDNLYDDPALSFVIEAIKAYQDRLDTGFELIIDSEFSSTIGLGSSAAITAAMVTLLNQLLNINPDLNRDFRQGLAIIHAVQQGRGSGADLAASLAGGVVCFTQQPLQIKPISPPESLVLALYYSGYKMKTPDVLAHVEQQWQARSMLQQSLYQLMGDTCRAAIVALENQDLAEFGQLMNVYQGLMDALGVCDATLANMIYSLRQDQSVQGAKISGSGLGDCVLTLGTQSPPSLPNHSCLSIRTSQQGILIDGKAIQASES
ncbi:MAG: GHMP kinase [Oceanospirillales bacterium]|nr:MAG: GHMP kinase [Oceanospirillales bacterium]